MFCTACAALTPDGADRCPVCGRPLLAQPVCGRPTLRRQNRSTRMVLLLLPFVTLLAAAWAVAAAGRSDDTLALQRVNTAVAAGDYRDALHSLDRLTDPSSIRLRAAMLDRLDPAEHLLSGGSVAAANGDNAAAADHFAAANRQLPNLDGAAGLAATARSAAIASARRDLADAIANLNWGAAERAARAAVALDPGDGDLFAAWRAVRHDHAEILVPADGEIALVDPSTGTSRGLFAGMAAARPAWSPDRTRVAFLDDGPTPDLAASLWVVADDGTPPRRVVDNVHPSAITVWSPDGRSIAYTSVADRDLANGIDTLSVHVVDVATGVDRNVTAQIGRSAVTPSWSPDGRLLAFVARADDSTAGDGRPADVMTVDPVTLQVRNLTNGQFPGVVRVLWSPAGDRLLAYGPPSPEPSATGLRPLALATVDARSGAVEFVRQAILGTSTIWSPAWSPDGRSYAFVDRATDVVVVSPAGERHLASDHALLGSVSWSPDGSELLAPAADFGRPSLVVDTTRTALAARPIMLEFTPGAPLGPPQWGPATQPPDPASPGQFGTGFDRNATNAWSTNN